MTKPLIYMNELTCLNCGIGFYDGYVGPFPIKKTAPCQICGHQAPASMSQKDFRLSFRCRGVKYIMEQRKNWIE
jgi:hypothetical protein